MANIEQARNVQEVGKVEYGDLPLDYRREISESCQAVSQELRRLGLNEDADKIDSTPAENIFLFARDYRDYTGRSMGFLDEMYMDGSTPRIRTRITGSTIEPIQRHIIRHELFHWIRGISETLVRGRIFGISGMHVSKTPPEQAEERVSYFLGWNEALIDLSAIRAGGLEVNDHMYKIYRFVAKKIAEKVYSQLVANNTGVLATWQKVFPNIPIPANVGQVIDAFTSQALREDFSHMQVIEQVFGRGSAKKLGELGQDRDKDSDIFLYFVGEQPEDLGGKKIVPWVFDANSSDYLEFIHS